MKEQPNYYSIIPADVRYDDSLKPNEKLLYGEITALANKNGFCWAENNYFADLYDVTKTTVSRWVSNLEKQGYVTVKLIYKDKSKQVASRRIYISDPLLIKKSIPPIQKNQYPIDEKRKEELNTTSTNITSTNKEHSPADAEQQIPFQKIIEYLNKQAGRSFKYTTDKTQRLIKARFNDGFTAEDFSKVIDIKVSQWKGQAEMEGYLRPETLFGTKFEGYLNEQYAEGSGDSYGGLKF